MEAKITAEARVNGEELEDEVSIEQIKGDPAYNVIRQEYEDARQTAGKYDETQPPNLPGKDFKLESAGSNWEIKFTRFDSGEDHFTSQDYDWFLYNSSLGTSLESARNRTIDKTVTCTFKGNEVAWRSCMTPGEPFFHILSDYRNPAHNVSDPEASGSSFHQYGKAADFNFKKHRWESFWISEVRNNPPCKPKALFKFLKKFANAGSDSYYWCTDEGDSGNKVHGHWP